MVKKFSVKYAKALMNKERKLLNKLKYSSGGYYLNQANNHNIYIIVRNVFKDLPQLDSKYYDYFKNWNFHSLNQLLVDLGKFQTVKFATEGFHF